MDAKHLLAFLRPRLSKLAHLSLATLASSAARRVEEKNGKIALYNYSKYTMSTLRSLLWTLLTKRQTIWIMPEFPRRVIWSQKLNANQYWYKLYDDSYNMHFEILPFLTVNFNFALQQKAKSQFLILSLFCVEKWTAWQSATEGLTVQGIYWYYFPYKWRYRRFFRIFLIEPLTLG